MSLEFWSSPLHTFSKFRSQKPFLIPDLVIMLATEIQFFLCNILWKLGGL